MDEIALTLNGPITEEQWDMIEDVDFDHTSEITFHTKHGKVVKFVKSSAQPEIVYCKDCICSHGEVWLSGNGSADLYGYCGRTQLRVLPYDYCSYAERRANE